MTGSIGDSTTTGKKNSARKRCNGDEGQLTAFVQVADRVTKEV